MRQILKMCVDLLFPRRCPLCEKLLGSNEYYVCRSCSGKLSWIVEPICKKCGKPIRDACAEFCMDCQKRMHVYDHGRSVFVYEGAIRMSLMRMKFYNRREYIVFYAQAIAQYIRYLPDYMNAVIVPIPMHPRKKRQRGYDQCMLLTRQIARLTNQQVDAGLLCRVRRTKPQKGLNAQARAENLQGAFRLGRNDHLPERVILLDDIYTTGTTMDAAAKVLKEGGVRRVNCLSLCIVRGREDSV